MGIVGVSTNVVKVSSGILNVGGQTILREQVHPRSLINKLVANLNFYVDLLTAIPVGMTFQPVKVFQLLCVDLKQVSSNNIWRQKSSRHW